MTIHVHHTPMRLHSERADGERWCFYCRKRVPFVFQVHVTTEPSYYGPSASVRCEPRGHLNGDLFPGHWREWSET